MPNSTTDPPLTKDAYGTRFDVAVALVLGAVTLLVVVEAVFSIRWRLGHDTSILHYIAFLLDTHGYAPYRDVFEMSFPGTLLYHLAVVRLFGFGAPALMVVNLVWLAALSTVTYSIMIRFGWRTAWAAVVLFAAFYFQGGRPMMAQRDSLLILPVSTAILVLLSNRFGPMVRPILIGALVGIAATIKPHSAIALPLLVVFEATRGSDPRETPSRVLMRRTTRTALLCGIGFSLPLLIVLVWVWMRGGWHSYIEMVTQYLPLYVNTTGDHETIYGFARIKYLVRSYLDLGPDAPWLIGASLGTFVALFGSQATTQQRRVVYLLLGSAVLFSAYVVFGGKFWPYHWMPFSYFVILLGSLCLSKSSPSGSAFRRSYPPLVLLVSALLILRPAPELPSQLRGETPFVLEGQRVDEIAGFLETHMNEGDLVQPLDWTGGTLHAMLLAKAEVATPFISDFHFYHDISDPFIQTLRERFLRRLKKAAPRFIVEVETFKPWVWGPGTTREFPALRRILDTEYSVVLHGDGYLIHERRRRQGAD